MSPFAATEILDRIHRTYFYGIRQIRMKDRSFIEIINPTFIALTVMAINHCLSAWKTGKFTVPPQFGPGGGAQRKCNTRNINHVVNNACIDVFHRLYADYLSSLPEVQAKNIDNIRCMIRQRIQSTGMDPVMAQPHNDQGSYDEDFFDYIPEELIEHPDNSINLLSSSVAATEASMRFKAVLPIGGSAIASSSQPIPCSNSNSNSNEITSITNMTSVENTGLVNGSTIVEGAMSLGS